MAKLLHSITIYKNIWVIEILLLSIYQRWPCSQWSKLGGRYSCYPQTL